MYDAAADYVRNIDADDTVVVVHHWDMDGSAAAAITGRILKETRGRDADTVLVPEGRKHQLGPRVERRLRSDDVSHLIVLDMGVDNDRVADLSDLGVAVLVIDHHGFDEVPEEAVFVNPRIEDEEAYVPAAKLCNDLAARFDLAYDWIAGLGIVQDFAVDDNVAFLEALAEEYPDYFPAEIDQHNMAKECQYGKVSSVLNIKPYKDTDACAKIAYQALMAADDLPSVEETDGYERLYDYYREMYAEIDHVTANVDSEKETYADGDLVFFRFDSAYHINSSIATQISLDDEDTVYLIANTHGNQANISARCQSGRVDLGRLLQEALPDDVDGEAGGHRRAAGASLPADRLDAFVADLAALLD